MALCLNQYSSIFLYSLDHSFGILSCLVHCPHVVKAVWHIHHLVCEERTSCSACRVHLSLVPLLWRAFIFLLMSWVGCYITPSNLRHSHVTNQWLYRGIPLITNSSYLTGTQNRREGNDQEPIQLSHTSHQTSKGKKHKTQNN